MSSLRPIRCLIEPLEARIAPAVILPTIRDAELAYDKDPFGNNKFKFAAVDTPILLRAGDVLSTADAARAGTYLLFVEKGQMMVFTTDLNNNGSVDFNEITGIAAGDGLRFTSFVDIHGDIITNLDADTTLSDSDSNSLNDPRSLKGDGRILNNSRIEAITLRSLTLEDITAIGGGEATEDDLYPRVALSSYSIHGQVIAGKGFGVVGDVTSGLLVDSIGFEVQETVFGGGTGLELYVATKPTIGAIRTGTAGDGEYFSFGASRGDDVQGVLRAFATPDGQVGGDIYNVRGATGTSFNVSGLLAGKGGYGARGGNIELVTFNDDNASGYQVIAGNGGAGPSGGAGGSIINFTDLGSVTGSVKLGVGSGGDGTTGNGGNGGKLELGEVPPAAPDPDLPYSNLKDGTPLVNININAGFTIDLGDGGNGFKGGGNGASLKNARIVTPDNTAATSVALVASTQDGQHDPATGRLLSHGVVGKNHTIDFNQDGFTDIVFTTSNPEQLVVQFGVDRDADPLAIAGDWGRDEETGRFIRIYLDGPINAEALAVADFNGDGHQDIVVGSSDPGNFAGITVYLAKWEDGDANGLTKTEDSNQNKINDFLGFHTGRTSTLPSLASGDPNAVKIDPFFNVNFDYLRTANAITDIATGDFDGDGYTDVALTATYVSKGLNGTPKQVLIMMSANVEDNRPTGEFFADFGAKKIGDSVPADPNLPFFELGASTNARIASSSLDESASYDIVVGGVIEGSANVGGRISSATTRIVYAYDFSAERTTGPIVGEWDFGTVDTNRKIGDKTLEQFKVRDFTLVDFDEDGLMDLVGISESPAGYAVGIRGNGSLASAQIVTGVGDQAGILFTEITQFKNAIGTSLMAIRSTEQGGDPNVRESLSVLMYSARYDITSPGYVIVEFGLSAKGLTHSAALAGEGVIYTPSGAEENIVAFDTFVPKSPYRVTAVNPFDPNTQYERMYDLSAGEPTTVNYATGLPGSQENGRHVIESFGDTTGNKQFLLHADLAERFVTIEGGDGGDGTIGRGGAGGFIGGGKLKELDVVDDLTGVVDTGLYGSVDITLPTNRSYAGVVTITGGHGGNGFTSGGAGGGVLGAAVRYANGTGVFHSVVFFEGGDGGFGISGAGGNGGSLVSIYAETGVRYLGGDGGDGRTGGQGGSITGHGRTDHADNRSSYQNMRAGQGGDGVKKGGNGGSITNFHAGFDLKFFGDVGGILNYVGGDAGRAVSGPGGNGGDVTNVSPFRGENALAGDIYMRGGAGGDGRNGGRGGDVLNFDNKPSGGSAPRVLSVLGGNGGNGVQGAGGRGGNISNITATTNGAPDPLSPVPVEDGQPYELFGYVASTRATVYDFNRIVAGAGGTSSGSVGGAGGKVSQINSGAESNPMAVVGGAGGAGLRAGGHGGDVVNVLLGLSGGEGKGLVIAGEGGSVGAKADLGPNSFGYGKVGVMPGRGGNGGSIVNFSQPSNTDVRVDLIAGNGGDNALYGKAGDSFNYVGQGGSIRNANLYGFIGGADESTPLKSYNDLASGETVGDFVEDMLRDRYIGGSISDTIGNVGAVVGAAGRLKPIFVGYDADNDPIYRTVPAKGGINGDFVDITAREITSAVAGSIEQIAAIRVARDISVISAGRVGIDKDGVFNYLNVFGESIPEPVTDGRLIDGALIVASQPTRTVGGKQVPTTVAGNVFVLLG